MPALIPRLAGALAYGGDYNPEQWPEDVWPEDARLMREAGVNLVSVGIFSWARIQPTVTTWDFAWLDRVLDLLHAHGVRVCLATATASPPPWLARLHPDSLPVTADGVALQVGARQQFSPSSPDYRRHAAALVRRLAKRYAKHPALAVWHVNNEYGCHVQECHGPHSVRAFRAWLKMRYGTLDALNAAWGTAFWSQIYGDWADINTPKRTPYIANPAQQLDFKRFTSEAFLDLYRMERDILRRATPDVPITTNLMAPHKPLDYRRWAPEMDFTSWDSYPDPAAPDEGRHFAAVGHDLIRSLKRDRPFVQMEAATSAVNWRPLNRPKPPGLMRLQSLQAVARGADGMMFFQWRASLAGGEKFHSGMVPHAPTERSRIFAEVRQVGAELQRLALVTGSLIRARVAIAMDWEAWWGIELEAHPVRLDYNETLHTVHQAFYAQNIAVDFVHPEESLEGYDLIVAPVLYLLSQKGADNLSAFVRRGGTLLATYATGVVDENDRIVPGGYPGRLRETLGIWVEEWVPLRPGTENPLRPAKKSGLSLTGRVWTEWVHADGAQVLATFADDMVRGLPALTSHKFGAGRALYLAAGLDPADWKRLALQLAADAGAVASGAPLPALVEATTRVAADGTRFHFFLNHRAEPVSLRAPGLHGTDLLTDRALKGRVTLPALGAVVVAQSAPIPVRRPRS